MQKEARTPVPRRKSEVIASSLAILVAVSAGLDPLHPERHVVMAQQPSSAITPLEAERRPARFEVASIKPNPLGPDGPTSVTLQPGGRYVATNIPLRLLIGQTYHIPAPRLVGGPAWIESTHFDIDARANRDLAASGTDHPLDDALAALLADRFKLKLHTETRQIAVYNLVLADRSGRLGPNLTASTRDCDVVLAAMRGAAAGARTGGLPPPPPEAPGNDAPPCGARNASGLWVLDSQTLSFFAAALTSEAGRPVVDKTGLSGRYNLRLSWTPDERPGLPGGAADAVPFDADRPSLTSALRQQLGLRLENATAAVEFLIIDSVERPVPN